MQSSDTISFRSYFFSTSIVIWLSNPLLTSEKEESPLRYSIPEELPSGSIVSNLTKYAEHRHTPEVLKLLRFRFLTESVTMFGIDSTSGIIMTTASIDRDDESLCRQKEICEISLDVVIQPTQYFQIVKVIVEILDLNDNAPLFREPKISLPINEAALVDSSYIIPKAVDYDSPRYGIQRYELETDSNQFRLNVNSKLDGTLEVKLILHSKLDREVESRYELKITACDGGSPQARTGTLTVEIDVLDSNDNKPEFTSPQYRINISENIPIGSVFLRVQAVDRDSGANGLVGYTFAARTRSLHGNIFGIRNATGEIYAKGNIDHEKSASYQLVVVAHDHGPDVQSSEVSVTVGVDDLNDNAPSVTIQTLNNGGGNTGHHVADISEDAAVNTFVAHVTVGDRDSGVNGQVNCTINEKVFSLVQKSDTNYQIVTATPLDRERTEKYTLVMKCQDGATVSRVTEKALTIIVVDVNDNSPIFTRQVYKTSIVENSLVGMSVLQVSSLDYDEGDNGRIQYTIPGEYALWFHVDQRGIVSVQRSIDREISDHFQFPVLAIDLGSPRRTGSALVIITIEDTNDEPPRFTERSYIFEVPENEPIGTHVGSLEASDPDRSPNNIFFFAFSPSAMIADCFAIDHVTGTITTQKILDRETISHYEAEVTVYDQRTINMSDRAALSITVLDKNDNSPEFIFPTSTNNTVSVSTQLPVGHRVTQVLARDRDFGKNSEMYFTVNPDRSGGNTTFTIDPKTGILYLALPLEKVDFTTYHLTVRVSDQGNPSKYASSPVYINANASIPFIVLSGAQSSSGSIVSTYGLVVGIGVMSGCVLVIFVLVVAVVIVRQRDRHRDKFDCRMEGIHMLRTKEQHASCSSPEGTPHKKLQNGTKPLLSKDGVHSESNDPTETEKQEFAQQSCRSSAQAKIWLIDKGAEAQPSSHRPLDVEKDSVHSVEGSVTDSGRGPSEEGEAGHVRHNRERCIPPPPPPPRGAYWLMPRKSAPHGGPQHSHPTVRFQGIDDAVETLPNRTVNLSSPPGAAAAASASVPSAPASESRTLPCRRHSRGRDPTDRRDSSSAAAASSQLGLYLLGTGNTESYSGSPIDRSYGLRREASRTTDELSLRAEEGARRTPGPSSTVSLYGQATIKRRSHDWPHNRMAGSDLRAGPAESSSLVGPDVIV